jgi:Spy/CpxP family protein refolding chaperone
MTLTKFRKLAVRACALLMCSAVLYTAPMMAQGGGGGGRGRMSPENQLSMMTEQLNLTADQQPKVLAILQDSQKKMMDIRNSGADPQDMRPKMMAVRQDQESKIKALLTDEQKTKYDAMMEQMQNRMRGGQGGNGAAGGNGGAPPPPPQQ